jgi:hypothetical protein
VSTGGTPSPDEMIRTNLVRATGTLLNNPWRPVIVDRIDMEIELRFAREILRLRGAEVLGSEIDAGQEARIRLTLIPYVGDPITRVIAVRIPATQAGKTVSLELTPGYLVEKEKAPPENYQAMVDNLEDPTYLPKSVVVSYQTGDGAVAYNGHIARDLPPGALDTLRPTTSSLGPVSFQTEARIVVPLDDFMVGQDRVTVTVKPILR